jgi:hypothetical protein
MYIQLTEHAYTAGFKVEVLEVGKDHLGEVVTREFATCPICEYRNRIDYVGGRYASSKSCEHRVCSDSHPSPRQEQHLWVFAPVRYELLERLAVLDYHRGEA